MDPSEQPSSGAAQRRKQRRLRSWWRHEQQSIAAAHSALRGQKTATRAGEEGHEDKHDAPRRQKPPPPQPELFQLFEEEEPGGSRPPCLGEPRGPQEKVQQCTVEQLADVVPMVQILDTPGLLGEDQVVEVLRMLDVPAFEQVIAVPKISLDRVHQRSAVRRPQKAEQLVEVPTDPGYSLAVIAVRAMGRRAALALAEQIVNNPAPQGRRGGGGGLQGLRAGQGSTAADVEQIIDIPVPHCRRRSSGSPQGSLPGRGSTANVEQIVEIPARGGL